MGEHCKTFQTISDYDSFKSSDDFILPNISYIYENESVDFNPDTNIDYSKEYFTIEALEDGTFVKHPDMTSLPSGASGIPEGWNVINNE